MTDKNEHPTPNESRTDNAISDLREAARQALEMAKKAQKARAASSKGEEHTSSTEVDFAASANATGDTVYDEPELPTAEPLAYAEGTDKAPHVPDEDDMTGIETDEQAENPRRLPPSDAAPSLTPLVIDASLMDTDVFFEDDDENETNKIIENGTTTYELKEPAQEALRMAAEKQEALLDEAEQRASSAMQGAAEDALFDESTRLHLEIAETHIPIPVRRSATMIIGRGDQMTNFTPEVDLTDVGAYRLGLSRRHAQFLQRKNRLFLQDLSSRNGTSVNGLRLEGEETRMVRNGDMIQLGNLALRVIFKRDEN